MKSNMIATTIEQSKNLLELGLNPETADMHYKGTIDPVHESESYDLRIGSPYSKKEIPAWSLAALLGVLPEGTRLLKSTNISSIGDTKYHCDCPKLNIDKWFDNPVDAYVAMIEKLNELNLL